LCTLCDQRVANFSNPSVTSTGLMQPASAEEANL
jgi:hypothetical protein